MQKRIVINVPMSEEDGRKKAMKLASEMKGVYGSYSFILYIHHINYVLD